MPSLQKVVVERGVLDSLPGLQVQLEIMIEQKQIVERNTFPPQAEYLGTFLWLLNTSQ
jgi:hypothetical protein